MPRKVIPKQRPPGLEPEPRAGQEAEDIAILVAAVRSELEARERARDARLVELMKNPPPRSSSSPSPRQHRIDPAAAARYQKLRLALRMARQLITMIEGDPEIAKRISVKIKGQPGRPPGVSESAIKLAHEVSEILCNWFVPRQRKKWPTAAEIAALLWIDERSDDDFIDGVTDFRETLKTLDQLPTLIAKRVRGGPDKRRSVKR
jgi:hypothetical protein